MFPSSSEYVTAVRNLDNFVTDSAFNGGKPVQPKTGFGITLYSGGYSRVFPINVGNKKLALRCWIADVGDAEYRYQEIAKYLRTYNLPYFVDFEYVKDGILVNGTKYPIIRMEWTEGLLLKEFIEQNIYNSNILRGLSEAFLKMVNNLHEKRISHGDLQDGNIIVRNNSNPVELKLIDYDSLCVPNLQGYPDQIVGIPAYQHPKRKEAGKASEKVDYFSELVIYLSIQSFADHPDLWNKFNIKNAEGLLFSKCDFENPSNSPIFKELDGFSSTIQYFKYKLEEFCNKNSIDELIPLEDVVNSCPSSESSVEQLIDKVKKIKLVVTPLSKNTGSAVNLHSSIANLMNILENEDEPATFQPRKTVSIHKSIDNLIKLVENNQPALEFSSQQIAPIQTEVDKLVSLFSQTTKVKETSGPLLNIIILILGGVIGTTLIYFLQQKIGKISIYLLQQEISLEGSILKGIFHGVLFAGILLSIKKTFYLNKLSVLYTALLIIILVLGGDMITSILEYNFGKQIIKLGIPIYIYYGMIALGILLGCKRLLKIKIKYIIRLFLFVIFGAIVGNVVGNFLESSLENAYPAILDGEIINQISLHGMMALIFLSEYKKKISLKNITYIISITLTVMFGTAIGNVINILLSNSFHNQLLIKECISLSVSYEILTLLLIIVFKIRLFLKDNIM